MSDEFDDTKVDLPLQRAQSVPEPRIVRLRAAAPRLVSRLYRAADHHLRAQILARLIHPLGSLGLAAVAAGSFAAFLGRRNAPDQVGTAEELARLSTAQILELSRFVEQVSPDALQHVAQLASENAFGLAAFSASVAVLLYRGLRPESVSSRDSP